MTRLSAILFVLFLCLGAARTALAQPFNVRAWYAQGQVFIVWEFIAPPPLPTDTVEIYASPAVQANTAAMTRIGRVFFPEYTGARLRSHVPGATLTIPTPGGATYTLLANEGVFAFTPRANGNLFFAVVDTGNNVVVPANSDATAFVYNPAADPVRPHQQTISFTPGGQRAIAYALWAEGRTDFNNARPDIPVLGNFSKNGVPHFFIVTEPLGGVPAGQLTCAFALHGGGGEYQLFLPGMPQRADVSLPLNNGVVVTPLDSIYARNVNALDERTTAWFGYDSALDPFTNAVRVNPPITATIVDFTQRKFFWIMDWILGPTSPYTIDPARVAIIGHSNGARGTSHLSRTRPDAFCATVQHCPPINFTVPEGNQADYLRGRPNDNTPTNLPNPTGVGFLGVKDIFTPYVRIAPSRRDLPITRFFFGKQDTDEVATWNAGMIAEIQTIDAWGMGMIFWDEREHGVEKWATENAALAGPDIAQWVSPVRTRRAGAQYLVDRYRAGQTYPGFAEADQDIILAGQQLDPGDGVPSNGAPWGTWGGYFDWVSSTITDLPGRWECTVFATATAPASVDIAPVTEFTTDVTPRYTSQFSPAPGATVYWYVLPQGSAAATQQGTSIADDDGVAFATGVVIPREDIGTTRVFFSLAPICVGSPCCDTIDFNNDGSSFDPQDIDAFLSVFSEGPCIPDTATCGDIDFNNDGALFDPCDIDSFLLVFSEGPCTACGV
jgi:hypothetical protein